MIRHFLNIFKQKSMSRSEPVRKPHPSALVLLDHHTLEDIGVSPTEVAMSSLLKAARWDAGVIARGHSARWSLSGDWDRHIEKKRV